MRSCTGSQNISFPLRTNISDISGYYAKIHKDKPNIKATFTPRNTNPNFNDSARVSGAIDESRNSINITYNDVNYYLQSIQICLATHSDWLLTNNDPSVKHHNKIDIVITMENTSENDPRFFISTIPLILDNKVTIDNTYLQGLAYLNELNNYSLQSLFVGLVDNLFYTTCLEPHGDNVFVYVNTNGIRISNNLYTSLLSIWTNQNLSTVQQKVLDTVGPLKKNITNYLQQINTSTNLAQIQYQLDNIQKASQTPTINPSVDTWPRYCPPYDIILNVPANIITASTKEGFAMEGFVDLLGATNSGDLAGSTKTDTSGASVDSKKEQTVVKSNAPVQFSLGNIQCVPLDIDTVDSSGNINFDSNNMILLSEVQNQRNALRNSAQIGTSNLPNLLKGFGWFVVALIGVILIHLAYKHFYPSTTASSHLFPSDSKHYGLYAIILVIFAFTGFIIGVAVHP